MLTTDQAIPSLEAIGIPITAQIEEGPPDAIPGLVPKQGQLVIAGETEVGKTLCALEICSSLAIGEPLWGELVPNMKAKRILYCLGEHYVTVIQRLAQKTQLPMSDQIYVLGPEQLGWDKWLVTSGRPNIQSIGKFKRWAEGCDLVVFDPLSSFVVGTDVENDNSIMRTVLDSMSLICQSAGASCLVLAHQGKPMMDRFGQEHRRQSYAVRGASSIEDAATNIFYMSRVDTSDKAQNAAEGHLFELKKRKYKGDAPSEHRLMRNPNTLTHTLVGDRSHRDVNKTITQAKMNRLEMYNHKLDFETRVRILAAVENVPETTVKRWLGVKVEA